MHHLFAQEKTRDRRYEQTLVRLRHEQTLDRRSEARKKVGNVATQIDLRGWHPSRSPASFGICPAAVPAFFVRHPDRIPERVMIMLEQKPR
jgi:hypothetical protein